MWIVGVAKAGKEENCDLLGQSCIIAPTGEIVAMCSTIGDELATANVSVFEPPDAMAYLESTPQ